MDDLNEMLEIIVSPDILVLAGYEKAFLGISLVHGAYVAVYDLDKAITALKEDLPEELEGMSKRKLIELQFEAVEHLGTKAPIFVQAPQYSIASFAMH